MENIIHYYLQCIPLTSVDLFSVILSFKPSYTMRRESGFPTASPNFPNQVTSLFSHTNFSNSSDPADQKCKRCKKPFSLLEKDWYVDEAGCSYHLGKRVFCDGPENGLYNCCKGVSDEVGCAFHKYHVSEFRPVDCSRFVRTIIKGMPCCDLSNVFGLDCEMVYTTIGIEVVRVSLVSIYGVTLYDSLVLPENPVLDFNTIFSGVKSEDLDGVRTTLADAQNALLRFLNTSSILIGHGLENDLLGLRLYHKNVVDTSLIYGHERGFPYRHSLRTLAYKYLQQVIHSDFSGHNSVEDAKTSIALLLRKIHDEIQVNAYFCPMQQLEYRYAVYVPTAQPIPCRVYAFDQIQKPYGNVYGAVIEYPNGQKIVYPKYVQFEAPVYPVFPPPAPVYLSPVAYAKHGKQFRKHKYYI